MTNIELQNETAIQDEQQLKSKQEISNKIIKILAENNYTITESKDILNIVLRKLGQQIVKVSS